MKTARQLRQELMRLKSDLRDLEALLRREAERETIGGTFENGVNFAADRLRDTLDRKINP